MPELTARVVRASFPKGTLAVRVREALGPLFEDESFAEAFSGRGRPAVSPGALALVSVLQYAEGLTDRQAADQVRARMDWKFLLGLELDDAGFDFSVLCDFRARLIEHGLEEKVLDLVLERISGIGLLRAGGRQRTDSTHVLAAVRTLNRMEFVGETLRSALEALSAAAPQWLSALVTADWVRRYGARIDSYRFPKGENVRQEWAEQVGRDGFSSPYDPDARYGVKRGSGWCGYKTHLSETCEPDVPHLITHVVTTDATVADTEVTETVHQGLAARELLPAEHDVDAGYVTAAHIVTARNEYGIELVGPVGLDTCHENHEGEHFTQSAFTVDWQTRKVTCPEGKISASWSDQRKSSGTPIARVHFTAQDCGSCPVREKCTKAANGTWGRSLTLLPRDQQEALEARRREQLTDEWQQRYNIRAGVESTISQAVRRTRIRRTRFTDLPKTHLGHVFAATAINIIRLDAWLTQTPLGQTRTSHLARLGLAA
ncbi:IS1182 family transposase [Streptomyces sp. NPDC004393]